MSISRAAGTLALAGMSVAFFLATTPADARAQGGIGSGFPFRIAGELRGGLNVPGDDFLQGGGQAGGASFGGALGVGFTESLAGYLELTRAIFDCEDTCPEGEDPTSDGLGIGVKWTVGQIAGFRPWLAGGAILHTLEQDIPDGAEEIESDDGLGFQVALGADLPLGETIALVPAVRYYRYDAEFTTLGFQDTVSWLQADVGLRFTFTGR